MSVNGVNWAYRRSEVPKDKAEENQKLAFKPTVLLLHGLGSSSFSYRRAWRVCAKRKAMHVQGMQAA